MTKITEYNELKHGARAIATIKGVRVRKARISIDQNGNAFICQDSVRGQSTENMFNFKYAIMFASKGEGLNSWENSLVRDLFIEESGDSRETITWDNLEEGDILIDPAGKDEHTVLSVFKKLLFISKPAKPEEFGKVLTISEAKQQKITIKQKEAMPNEIIIINDKVISTTKEKIKEVEKILK